VTRKLVAEFLGSALLAGVGRRIRHRGELLLVIFSLLRTGRAALAPATVGAYIGAAYFLHQLHELRQPGDLDRTHVQRHLRRHRARVAGSIRSRPLLPRDHE
jgi:hypothetical protein